jgi:hypothetical protein
MTPTYLPILKALQSEYEASAHVDPAHLEVIHPLFDVPAIGQQRRDTKKYRNSLTPVSDYLDEVAKNVGASWKGASIIADAFNWAAAATVETGEQAIAYLYASLRSEGLTVAPVVGYDRWDDPVYRVAMRGLDLSDAPYVCLRLETSAMEDAIEPEVFHDRIREMLEDMELGASDCAVLVDFGDLTTKSLLELTDEAARVLGLLGSYGFRYIATAGCSMPKSVDLAVSRPDSKARVVRKEMLLWQTMRAAFPNLPLVYGDYGVRGPGSNEGIRNPHTNAKIRYTADKAFLVVRGHSVKKERQVIQMPKLARAVVNSRDFLAGLSWGDRVIQECSSGLPVKGGHGKWIAYDTSHHLAFVVEELREFERVFARSGVTVGSP